MPILPMIKANEEICYSLLNLNWIFNFSGENFKKKGNKYGIRRFLQGNYRIRIYL